MATLHSWLPPLKDRFGFIQSTCKNCGLLRTINSKYKITQYTVNGKYVNISPSCKQLLTQLVLF